MDMDIQYYESVETGAILKGPRIESVFNDIYGPAKAFLVRNARSSV